MGKNLTKKSEEDSHHVIAMILELCKQLLITLATLFVVEVSINVYNKA